MPLNLLLKIILCVFRKDVGSYVLNKCSTLDATHKRINYRPKKCLGFKQPAVIFKEMCMAA
ncbi:hypothetical protein NL53_05975 [Vibrio variabilis]|uniref:Mobile element protein n=1 Tax=Vibrio variabilis TaxID=990271 RepID=A0ABR4YD07_9VIBR|nr:hypothetical protein NL53_05975 [Vibrio variabilis]